MAALHAQLAKALDNATLSEQTGISPESKPAVVQTIPELPSESLGRNFREMNAGDIAQAQQNNTAAASTTTSGSLPAQSTGQTQAADILTAENSALHKLLLKLDPALVDQVPADNNAQLKLIARLMSGPNALAAESDQTAVNTALKKVVGSSVLPQSAVDAAMDEAGLKSVERNVVAGVRSNPAAATSGTDTQTSEGSGMQSIAVSKEQRAKENILLACLASDVVKNLSKEERQRYNDKSEWDAVNEAKDYGKLEKLKEDKVNKHFTDLTAIVKELDRDHPDQLSAALNARQGGEKESLQYLMRAYNLRSREIALERQEIKNDRARQEMEQDADRHRQRMETIDQKQQQAKIKGNLNLIKQGLVVAKKFGDFLGIGK